MPAGFFVDGQLTYQPLIATTVSFQGTGGLQPGAKTLAVVGEFPFLDAGVVYAYTSRDQFLRAAPNSPLLKDLARIIYRSSARPESQGAPDIVYLVNVKPNTRASAFLVDEDNAPIIKLSSNYAGLVGNLTSVGFETVTGGTRMVVSNSGISSVVRIPDTEDVLEIAYAHPVSAPGSTAFGFDGSGNGSGMLEASKDVGDNDITIEFQRNITHAVAGANATHTSWQPDGPVKGVITISVPGGETLTTGPNLNVTVVGINSVSGVAATDVVTFSKAEVEGGSPITKQTTVNFASVSRVAVWSDDGAGDWTGGMTFEGLVTDQLGPALGLTYAADAIAYLNGLTGFSATTQFTQAATVPIAELDALDPDTLPVSFNANRWNTIRTINRSQNLLTAEVVVPFGKAPDIITPSGFTLQGGIEGTTTLGTWQGGAEALILHNVTVLYPYTTDDTIHAAFKEHVRFMWGVGAQERQLTLAAANEEDFAALQARVLDLNDYRVTLIADAVSVRQWDGQVRAPSSLAAGLYFSAMQCANDVAEPLGWRYPDIVSTSRYPNLVGRDGVETLLSLGITPLAEDNTGLFWSRWVTTHLDTDDQTRTEGSAVESTAFVLQALRDVIRPFVQQTMTEGLPATIREVISTELGQLVTTGWMRAWDSQSLSVTEQADRIIVNVRFAPALPLNAVFINAEVYVAAS